MKHWKPSADQETAVKAMLSQAAVALFADPGKGKTSISLAAFKVLKDQGLAKKMLVVAPLFPAYNSWPGELGKWAEFSGLTYTIIHGPKKEQQLAQDVDIYIINYEGLLWLFPEPSGSSPAPQRHARHLTWDWDVLCLDEGTNLKDTSTKRYKRLRGHFHTFRRRWLLTGTPIPNGYADLFGQIFILDNGAALGRYITHFRNSFMIKSFNGFSYDMRPGAAEEIEERIKPLVVRLEADYDHTVQPLWHEVYLPDDLQKKYKEFEDEFIMQVESGEVVASNAAVLGGKLRQFANGALYLTDDDDKRRWEKVHGLKLDQLQSILSELNGFPCLVFYEFQSDRDRILARWPNTPTLGGGQSPAESVKIIDRFNEGKIPMLIAHPKSAAHGLNLQGFSNRVIWFGMTWNLEWYQQAIARLARQGQKHAQVFVHHIIAAGTSDERVKDVLQQKGATQKALLDALSKR